MKTVNAIITQVMNRKYNGNASYIACAKSDNSQLRFVGTGDCPFSEFSTYNISYTTDIIDGNRINVDSTTIIEKCTTETTLNKLVEIKGSSNSMRLNALKCVVLTCDEITETDNGGKRRKIRVIDETMDTPVNVMAYKDAADENWSPGDVLIFYRPRIYAPDESEYRSLSIFDKPVKSGNDQASNELHQLFKSKYSEKNYTEITNIGDLSNAKEGDYLKFSGMIVKADAVGSNEGRDGRTASKYQNIYVADLSEKYVNCVLFNQMVNSNMETDRVVQFKVRFSGNGYRKNFIVNQMEEVEDTDITNWWSGRMWIDLLPLFKIEARDQKRVREVVENCKEWCGEKKRVSVEGVVTRTGDKLYLEDNGSQIEVKEINSNLPEGVKLLIENAPVNENGITVFPDTKFNPCS